jgi:putative chitinase
MTNFRTLQMNLRRDGFDPGPVDGVWGAKTLAALMGRMAARQPDPLIRELAAHLVAELPRVQVDTPLRILHFLAQGCHETGGFSALTENLNYRAETLLKVFPRRVTSLGDAQKLASQGAAAIAERVYGGRADLGNSAPGDGGKYRGRGFFQTTGKANYTAAAQALPGLDCVAYPERLAEPEWAVRSACVFWRDHGLNGLADADNVPRLTKLINGGQNGMAERKAFVSVGKSVWGL